MAKKIKTKRGFIFKIVLFIAKIFKKEPKIYNENEGILEQTAILISNHSAASGPMTFSLYLPTFFTPWGTFEMTGRYSVRWKYLYHVFYQQKLGYSKFKSFIIATLFAIISKMLYNGMQLIPTYQDMRFFKTIKLSEQHLEKGNSILIFPENSNTGYHEMLLEYFPGFVSLHQQYLNKHQIDLPVYPIYFHKISNTMIIGKKEYLKEKYESGMTREEIAEDFRIKTNKLAEKLFRLNEENRIKQKKVHN